MKTTLVIDDDVMTRLRKLAAERRTTMSALVEAALRTLLDEREAPGELPELPSFECGGARVDVADRDALYRGMDES